MNKKDYSAIAEIIKKQIEKVYFIHDMTTGSVLSLATVTNELADYFEREDIKCHICNKPMKVTELKNDIYTHHKECLKCKTGAYVTELFNRQQFLKDCGVEK